MRNMAVISTDPELNDRIGKITSKFNNLFYPVFLDNAESALEYLKYELPELCVLHYSDAGLDAGELIADIKKDQWLHYSGLILVHNLKDRPGMAEVAKNMNVILSVARADFVRGFFRVLRILLQNRQIIFQRDLQRYLLKSISGSLVMDNDPYDVGTYANLIPNYLYNSNYLNQEGREKLHVALFEMLMNAVEHGNCAITYEEKKSWLETHGDILDLVRVKNQDPEVRRRKVNFSYRITPERSSYSIRDEGEGFDWRSRLGNPSKGMNLEQHGRGIIMTEVYAQNLTYNEQGNEVSFEILHKNNESNVVPSIFSDQEEVEFQDKEVVFREGEESNYLYYIVSGKLDIYSGGRLVSHLSPDDLFLGEMSFLLSNRRSATVISQGLSVLIKVGKNAFVNSIKMQPHYGILLARLLAARLDRLNSQVSRLQEDLERQVQPEGCLDPLSSL